MHVTVYATTPSDKRAKLIRSDGVEQIIEAGETGYMEVPFGMNATTEAMELEPFEAVTLED